MLGARVLGEFGDDPNRYTDAKSRRNYAGTSPLTVASGRNAPYWPATCATAASMTPSTNGPSARSTISPGARVFYDQHRAAGDIHHQALRALGNRLVGILHGCLRHHAPYNEHTAWAHRHTHAGRLTTYEPGMSDMEPLLSSGQGEAAATTVVGAAASVTE